TQTDGKGALIVVDYGGSCTVNGGDFFVEGSSNYSVVNDGNMVINGGIFGTTNSGSSLIITGPDKGTVQEDYGQAIQSEGAYLEINGGAFLGGKHVVKNGLHSTLVITGGEFDGFIDDTETYEGLSASEDIIYDASGDCTISGGTFGVTGDTSSSEMYQYVIRAGATGSDDPDSSNEVIESVVITGGEFHSGTNGLFNISNNHSTITLSATMFVTLQEIISTDTSIEVTGPSTEDGSYVLSMKAAE
ncbi:MAG: hypothetical protein LUC16_02040, partial [Coprobacillus sp.]|nr:hypothetical protein [Coprobacillus sp.]